MTLTYHIAGMTCSGCASKVKSNLLKLPNVNAVDVDQPAHSARITMQQPIGLAELQHALGGKESKCQIEAMQTLDALEDKASFWLTYRPVLLLFGYITIVAGIGSWRVNDLNWMLFMRIFMAGFFLAFSFFKLLNLKAFAESYAMYDVVAKKIKSWGYFYAFVELMLGLAYFIDFNPRLTNMVTFVVMSVSLIGVLQSVLNKKKIQCACLGTVFNLPMSTLTIIEDVLMILMSAVMLVR